MLHKLPTEMLEYIEKVSPQGTTLYQVSFLEQAIEQGATLQLDRPLIRLQRPDGVQFCTLDVTTGEAAFIQSEG